MMKKAFSLLLVLVLALGLITPVLAYETPDFFDLPADNWAYGPVMRMADQGFVQGTGGGNFSPEMKVSVAQFLTLVGRIVFPETTVGANDTWYGPYVAAAQANGLLAGTQVNPAAPEDEITRYDMAVILRAAAKKLGKAETLAQQSQVTDFGVIPNMYTEAVLAVYGMGLIKGDQAGKFNGSNTMQRNELATVIDRLVALKTPGGTSTEPENPVDSQPEMIHTAFYIRCITPEPFSKNSHGERSIYGVPLQLRYTEDGGKTSRLIAECTSYRKDSYSYVNLSLDVEKALVDNENGQFYFSGETEYNGQRLMTQDLRTDGRATIIPVDVQKPADAPYNRAVVELVPPTGFKRTVTVDWATSYYRRHDAIVQFRYYPEPENAEFGGGVLLCEANVSKEDGSYFMEFELDTVDYQRDVKCYRIETYDADDGTLLSQPDLKTFGETNPNISLD